MAKSSVWKDNNADLMIMPGSLPLYDGSTRNELTYYLAAGWDAVLDKDIDGDRAETTELENKEPRFGSYNAARRVARTLFLGSAPAAAGAKPGIRGLDRARVLLGCFQPGQTSSTYVDALGRLADRLHYLNSSGDRRRMPPFWFDTRANLRREMEDQIALQRAKRSARQLARCFANSPVQAEASMVFTFSPRTLTCPMIARSASVFYRLRSIT